MSTCIFCKIAAGEIPARIAHEDENCVAFHDLNPQAPVHLLVIPRRHLATMNDAAGEAELLGALFAKIPEIAASAGIREDGYRLVTNCGEKAGQSVFHLHVHLLGGRAMGWPPG